MRFKRTTKKFVLTITTQPDIFEKYPNFRYNWDSPEGFIRSLCKYIESIPTDEEGKNAFGHSIRVTPLTNAHP